MGIDEMYIHFIQTLKLMEDYNAEEININMYYKSRPVNICIKLGPEEEGEP